MNGNFLDLVHMLESDGFRAYSRPRRLYSQPVSHHYLPLASAGVE
jgi:hypothetical protein